MQDTSATWKGLWASGQARMETVAEIAGEVYSAISAPRISRALTREGLTVGNAVSAACQFSLRPIPAEGPPVADVVADMFLADERVVAGENYNPANLIPRAARVVIRMRLVGDEAASEWLEAGTFYISRRTRDAVTGVMELECYDALLKANAQMPEQAQNGAQWPRPMAEVAQWLAGLLGVELDARTELAAGDAYVIEAPEPGTTIHDVLGRIAAANGGNWIITPAGALRLVPLVSATGATGAEAAVEALGVTGALELQAAGTVTGVRYATQDVPVVLGNESGIVIEADVGASIASDLYDKLAGTAYQAYRLGGAIYDPAAELGDYVRGGAAGEVASVLYCETATLGPAFRGDISAPEAGELADEYPYIGASAKALVAAKVYAARQVAALDEALDQEEVFDRLTDGGAAQGIYLQDGKLYVNGTYIQAGTILATLIKGGTLTLGGEDNANGVLEILDVNGNAVGLWDNGGVTLSKGSLRFPVGGDSSGDYVAVNGNSPFESVSTMANGVTKIYVHSGSFHIKNETNGNASQLTPRTLGLYARDGTQQASVQLCNDTTGVTTTLLDDSLVMEDGDHDIKVWIDIDRGFYTQKNLQVSGVKSRVVSTDQYSDRLLYCYETPSPMFGDVGEGVIGEDGLCYIPLDAVFAQTIATEQYQVFLQKYGEGDCRIDKRKAGYFVVAGTPGLSFGWEVKAKQRDFDQRRLDSAQQPFTAPVQSYGVEAAQHIDKVRKERETV